MTRFYQHRIGPPPRAKFWTLIGLLLLTLFAGTIWLTTYISQPRSKPIARAGGDLAPTAATGEVAVRHPPKDQGRVAQ